LIGSDRDGLELGLEIGLGIIDRRSEPNTVLVELQWMSLYTESWLMPFCWWSTCPTATHSACSPVMLPL